ncbi:PAS domain-containing protein [Salinarimonas soli]|uniref:histidine kinase n=1 Tax=Salinarimonas soli TaxID=1638099 RepID=A0A5B2VD14_9HYPH|nr:PAS domain-containing protein [Salinarimonas soli]KAA2236209.1 PAS domain-containing protein [Salinarimonas soli]
MTARASTPPRESRSLWGQLTAVGLALVIPTLVFVGVLLWHYAAAERARVEEEARSAARSLQVAVDREIVGIEGMLEALATSPSLAAGDLPTFYRQARQLFDRTGIHISLRNTQGVIVLTTRVPYGGTIEASHLLRDADREVLRTGKTSVSDAFSGQVSHMPTIQVINPVVREGGIAYLLGASFHLDRMAGALARETLPEGWIGGLIDRQGVLLARTRDHEAHAGRPAPAGLQARAVGHSGTYMGTNPDGSSALAAYARSPLTGWYTAVSVPGDMVQAPLRRSLLQIVGLGLGLGGLAIALSLLVSRRIAGAVGALRDAAAAIRLGEAVAPVATDLAEVDDIGRALAAASVELKAREARLRRVLESTGDSVFVLDREGRFTYLNERARAHLAPGRDLVGRRVREVFPEDSAADLWRAFHDAAITGRPTRADQFYRPLALWFEAHAYPSDEGLTVFFRDVTEQRCAAGTVRDSEERLRLALSGAKAGYWQLALDPPSMYWDEGWRGLYGFSPDETASEELWRSRIHPDDRARIDANIRDGLAGTAAGWTQDYRIVHPDKGERWIHDRVRIRRDAAGRPVSLGGLHFDFTDRKRMEDALRESEARLRLAQTAGGILTWEWTMASGEVAWSGPLDVIGLPPGAPDPSFEDFVARIHPDDRAMVRERVAAALEGASFEAEFRLHDPGGGVRWIAGRGEAISDAPGKAVRIIGCNYDITARKEAEEALARLNANLERRVAEGTEKLVQLQKMESIGRLTGGIAHDFNNLLAVVLANLEVLRRRLPEGDDRASALVDNAVQGAERGAALTQRLLAFARRQDLRPEAVDLPGLVEGMADLLKRSLGPDIRIETRFAAGLYPALVDAHQLELAILNLAVNARDAMPKGGRLTIQVDEEMVGDGEALPPGIYMRVRVTDTGTGMDEATLRSATEPFFTTKEVGKGTGLGLSMVHGLAAQSGGAFTLLSAPGRGTTAEILLPRAAQAKPRVVSPAPEPAPGGAGPALSILVVDDDPLVLSGTKSMLEDMGHRAVTADSAIEALALLHGGQGFDIVITDEVMPGLRGLQLAAAIARDWPGLPVVLATGYADLPEATDDLVAARLDKPFRFADLEAVLGRIGGARAAAASAAPTRLAS